MSSVHKIIISCIVGLCFVGGSLALGLSFYKAKAPVRTVSVVGSATKDFNSDLIIQRFTITVEDQNIKDGYAKMKKAREAVEKYLKENGVDLKDVSFKNVSSYKDEDYIYDRAKDYGYYQFRCYKFSQEVRIESNAVKKIEALNLSYLTSDEVKVDVYDPSYYYTKLSDLKIEMLANATKDAKERAETIVKNAGGKLGGLKVSSMGVFQITSPNSSDEDYEWGGAFNTSSYKKSASITMRLTYYVK